MPSFDVTSRFNFPELDNAVNNSRKALAARFDFRGATVEIDSDRKAKTLTVLSDDAMKVRAVKETLHGAAIKRGLDIKAFRWDEPQPAAAGKLRSVAKIADGIEQDKAKEIVKLIKDSKLKVQASIQGDELRVTAKQIDDLQSVIKLLGAADLGIPLQYVNMKS